MTKRKKARITVSMLLVLLCMGIIFYFSSQTADESSRVSLGFAFLLRLPFGDFIVRKFAHFSEFALLGFLSANMFYQICLKNKPLFAFAVGAVYAVTDEIHQIFVDGRACQFRDMCIDWAGVLLGIAVTTVLLRLIRKPERN